MRLIRNVLFLVLVCLFVWAGWTPVAAQQTYCVASWNTCADSCSGASVPSCTTICKNHNPPWGFSGIDPGAGCGNADGRCQWWQTYVFKDCSCDCPSGGGDGGGGGGGGGICGGQGDPCFGDWDCCEDGYCDFGECQMGPPIFEW